MWVNESLRINLKRIATHQKKTKIYGRILLTLTQNLFLQILEKFLQDINIPNHETLYHANISSLNFNNNFKLDNINNE